MIDNETIKALECLNGSALKCRECSYSPRFKFPLCQQAVAKDALSLITRQNAEIERLENNLAMSKKDMKRAFTSFKVAKAKAKSDARREFAERVKTILEKHYLIRGFDCVIDSLLKEMESESDG